MIHAARYCDAKQPPAVATLPDAKKGWVQHLDARLLDPRLGGEVGARRDGAQHAQPGEDQRPRALRGDQLATGIQAQGRHEPSDRRRSLAS